MPYVSIKGTGSAVPDNIISNHDLEKMVATNDQWIRERTGIITRRVCDEKTSTSDLAIEASKNALDMSGYKGSDIDMIIVSTTTPDYPLFPSTGALIQNGIGAGNIPAFDISAACTGYIYALSSAYSFIHAGMYKRILLVSADCLTKFIDWTDRSTCILFGDGAGAMVLEASDNPDDESLLAFDIHSDGSGKDLLIVPSGGTKTPINENEIKNKNQYIKMDGPGVFKFAVNVIVKSLTTALHKASLKKEDISYFVPHQANLRIIDYSAKKLKLSSDQVMINLDKYGNTSSASIPLLIDEINRNNTLKKGDIIAAVGFGAGLTWGSAIIRW